MDNRFIIQQSEENNFFHLFYAFYSYQQNYKKVCTPSSYNFMIKCRRGKCFQSKSAVSHPAMKLVGFSYLILKTVIINPKISHKLWITERRLPVGYEIMMKATLHEVKRKIYNMFFCSFKHWINTTIIWYFLPQILLIKVTQCFIHFDFNFK